MNTLTNSISTKFIAYRYFMIQLTNYEKLRLFKRHLYVTGSQWQVSQQLQLSKITKFTKSVQPYCRKSGSIWQFQPIHISNTMSLAYIDSSRNATCMYHIDSLNTTHQNKQTEWFSSSFLIGLKYWFSNTTHVHSVQHFNSLLVHTDVAVQYHNLSTYLIIYRSHQF